nr:hypothetical protein [Vibrio cyclitrophicus]PMF55282.1 hypothetical protein BCV12_01950 [Vibrio cyclitrophicus]
MIDSYQTFEEFVAIQRSFFEDALLPGVNANTTNPNDIYSWNTNRWSYGGGAKGFLAGVKKDFTFHEVNTRQIKGLFEEGETFEKIITVIPAYQAFMKAYCVSLYQKRKPSGAVVGNQQLILKRIYVRMLLSGVEPHPVNITSQHLQSAVDLLAASRTGQSALTNASSDYDTAHVIAKNLNDLGFTQTFIDVKKKQKAIGTSSTDTAKKAKKTKYAEDLDEDEHEKNLTIQTFLNIVALRGMVQHDGEKIILNLVLLLLVTGFRHMEAAGIRYNSFKVVEIENKKTREMMEKRGLPTFFLGIKYIGEKGAGHRTHWVEPLAVDLVDSLWVDTLVLTERLRVQVEFIRKSNFQSLLPHEWITSHTKDNVVQLVEPTVNLDDIVYDVYESYSSTVIKRGFGAARDYAKKKIENSACKITPDSVRVFGQTKKEIRYKKSDIELWIRHEFESDPDLSDDLIFRFKDSKSNVVTQIDYEDLLFIIPQGSGATLRTGALKVVPQVVDSNVLIPFLGYGVKSNRKRSVFSKYDLKDENGEYSWMYSHVPRHGINTFFAIAGVADHLQAMFMGRVDISQNEKYQHLAIEEKRVTSTLATAGNSTLFQKEQTALETIKSQGSLGVSTKLSFDNALAQAIHTHTTIENKTHFITQVIDNSDSNVFSEFDDLFDMIPDSDKSDTVRPHADLSPMSIGSCMRKLTTFQCPYNLKCNDGSPCPYFTLTGREDELPKIEQLASNIVSEIAVIKKMLTEGKLSRDESQEILEELALRQDNIRYHLRESETFEREKLQINLIELDGVRKPKMLSTLFALEQRNIDKNNIAKGNK